MNNEGVTSGGGEGATSMLVTYLGKQGEVHR